MSEAIAKYRNKRAEGLIGDKPVVFASKLEKERYGYLLWLEMAHLIQTIHVQPEYELEAAFTRNGKKYQKECYRADFSYLKDDKVYAEDTKGGTLTALYRSKVKRFLKKYPDIVFIEVYKNSNGWIEREL